MVQPLGGLSLVVIQNPLTHHDSIKKLFPCCCVNKRGQHFKGTFFFDLWSAHEAPTHGPFHLSNLLQIINDYRMVDVEFFGNFSCNCERISFDDNLSWSLSTSSGWPPQSSTSRLLSPLQKFLHNHCTVSSV